MLKEETMWRAMTDLCRRLDERVRRAFSKTAMQYDVYAGLQKEMSRQLVASLSELTDIDCIVDVGCGTGRMTHHLGLMFPQATLIGVDAALGMCQIARERWGSFPVIQADARALPFQEGVCDLLVSNLVYQWIDDFDQVCREHSRILKPNGQWAFTLFIDGTLEELFQSVEACAPLPLRWPRFLTQAAVIEKLEAAGLNVIEVKEERWRLPFSSCRDLLRWLKAIGAHTNRRGTPLSIGWVRAAQRHYDEHHRSRWGVSASFRVGWFRVLKTQPNVCG